MDETPRHPATSWGVGEYSLMADRLAEVATRVVERGGVQSEDRVLDLACGTGNAALLAAGLGASVAAVDFEPALLALARERDPDGQVEWSAGDVTALEFADAQFSVVLSVFGVMYAEDQQAAARELARCCGTSGRVVLTAWTPGGFMPEMGRVLAPYLPPPPTGPPPSRWGDAGAVADLLGPHGIVVREASRHEVVLTFDHRDSAAGFLVRTAGHVLQERARLERQRRWGTMLSDVKEFVTGRDVGDAGSVELSLEYLLVAGVRR